LLIKGARYEKTHTIYLLGRRTALYIAIDFRMLGKYGFAGNEDSGYGIGEAG
jgi:hypothetical protein